MTSVKTKSDLKNQTDRYVIVEQTQTMYELIDGEYYAKLYFKLSDVMMILNKTKTQVYWLLQKYNIPLPASKKYGRIKIPLTELRNMANRI